MTPLLFKKIMVIFWLLWWAIAFWTDVIGLMAHYNLLHQTWAPDLNYPFLAQSLTMYHVPSYFPLIAYIGIMLWSGLATLAFIRAGVAIFQKSDQWKNYANTAFIISLCLWLAFFIADQLIMKFDLEANHMAQACFELLCYLAMYVIPDDKVG